MVRARRGLQVGLVTGGVMMTLALAVSGPAEGAGMGGVGPSVMADTPEAAGRYLVVVGGCNDCHTGGWAETNGATPEAEWLTGSPVGFRGPWGTSYPANLRRSAQVMTEEAFVARLRAGKGLPPMPWMNTAQMAESDLRAIYRYIRSLGPSGDPAPAPVGPGVEPTTPYIDFVPVMPG